MLSSDRTRESMSNRQSIPEIWARSRISTSHCPLCALSRTGHTVDRQKRLWIDLSVFFITKLEMGDVLPVSGFGLLVLSSNS